VLGLFAAALGGLALIRGRRTNSGATVPHEGMNSSIFSNTEMQMALQVQLAFALMRRLRLSKWRTLIQKRSA
jgi:hypothetical protein